MQSVEEIEQRISSARRSFDELRAEMARMIVGHESLIEQVFIALVCGGHCLLEGVPGLGKTLMVRSLGEVLSLSFSRIQFTPDLMPADITGTNMLTDDPSGRKVFEFQRGPVFAHIVLADEINRATPKTQSALLEAMQEQSVTVGLKLSIALPQGGTFSLDNSLTATIRDGLPLSARVETGAAAALDLPTGEAVRAEATGLLMRDRRHISGRVTSGDHTLYERRWSTLNGELVR